MPQLHSQTRYILRLLFSDEIRNRKTRSSNLSGGLNQDPWSTSGIFREKGAICFSFSKQRYSIRSFRVSGPRKRAAAWRLSYKRIYLYDEEERIVDVSRVDTRIMYIHMRYDASVSFIEGMRKASRIFHDFSSRSLCVSFFCDYKYTDPRFTVLPRDRRGSGM